MAKIISFPSENVVYDNFEKELNKKIQKVEEELGIEEDEPLTVLTDNSCITLINNLIDAKENIEEALNMLGYEESGELPWEE